MAARTALNAKQQRFVDEIVNGAPTATKAAIAAGYSEASASNTASALMRNPLVVEAIDEAQAKLRDSKGYSIEKALADLEDAAKMATEKKDAATLARVAVEKSKLFGLQKEAKSSKAFTLVIQGVDVPAVREPQE
jgi:phage terminase small subunit